MIASLRVTKYMATKFNPNIFTTQDQYDLRFRDICTREKSNKLNATKNEISKESGVSRKLQPKLGPDTGFKLVGCFTIKRKLKKSKPVKKQRRTKHNVKRGGNKEDKKVISAAYLNCLDNTSTEKENQLIHTAIRNESHTMFSKSSILNCVCGLVDEKKSSNIVLSLT